MITSKEALELKDLDGDIAESQSESINFKIRDVDWVVFFVPISIDNLSNTLGISKNLKKKICVCDTITINDITATLIHELTHAFIWEYGFSSVGFTEESVCDLFGYYGREIIALANQLIKEYENRKMKEKK